jgi:alpha/beta superfamily hydrolase
MQFIKGNYSIPAPHGQLEAIYHPGRLRTGLRRGVALVLHPHPLHGGTMHNKVVYRTAKALEESGFETLRFNFRGVGQSTGSYDHGVGEVEDARVALDLLRRDHPEAQEVLVAGFSFGSIVGLRLGCAEARVDRLIAIGMPVRLGSLDFLADCRKPILFLHGEMDEIAPLEPLRDLLHQLPATVPARLVTIPGAGHFFDHQAAPLMEAVASFAAEGPPSALRGAGDSSSGS